MILLSAYSSLSFANEGDEYAVLFSVFGGTANSSEIEDGLTIGEMSEFADGAVYTHGEVNRIVANQDGASENSNAPTSLFSNAKLFVNFYDIRAEYAKSFELATCGMLDIAHGVDLTEQYILCDGQSVFYGVNGNSIEIVQGDEVTLQIDLSGDHFTLNGKTYPVAE